MKNWKLLLCMVAAILMLTGCCSHDWEEADCKHPRTCSECGATEGEKGEHDWQKATCLQPKTCSVCGKEKGNLGDHKWKDATCTDPQTCRTCGETRGEAEDHHWEDTVCSRCGETREIPAATEAKTVAPSADDGSLGILPEDFVDEIVAFACICSDDYSAGEVLENSRNCYIRNINFQGGPALKLILLLDADTGNVHRVTVQQLRADVPSADMISLYAVPVAVGRPGLETMSEVFSEVGDAMTYQDATDTMVYEIYEWNGFCIQIWCQIEGESSQYEVEVYRPTVF